MEGQSSERVMGRWSMLATGVGFAIGAGIVTLVGQAIGMTGYSATLAYGIALLFGFLYDLPIIIATSAVSLNGGRYSLVSAVLGKYWGGLSICSDFMGFCGIALYAASFAMYVKSLFPEIPVVVSSVVVLTAMFLLNLQGVRTSSRVNNFLSVALIAGLGSFVILGLGKADLSLLTAVKSPDYMTNGTGGLLGAACVLMYSTHGHYHIMTYARHCKNPKSDIPFAIFGTTLVITVVYCSIMAVASTVLPLAEVTNQPLTNVAREIMPGYLFHFFIVFGPMAAILTTAQGRFVTAVLPVVSAVNDGWFPKSWAAKNKKGVAWKLYLACYLASLIPVFLGWDISMITNSTQMIGMTFGVLMFFALARLPKLFPEAWKNRKFWGGLSTPVYYVTIVGALCVQMYIAYNSIMKIKPYIVISSLLITIVSLIYAKKRMEKTEINVPDISKVIDE